MDLISHVTLLGGACDRATLVALRGAPEVDRALRAGTLVRTGRGHYALATSPDVVKRASAVAGTLSHRSAAQFWGWPQKSPPTRPDVTVPRERRLRVGARDLLVPHWADLPAEHVDGIVTTRERTLVDCMRNLPWDEALAIVDSAIRCDDVPQAEVVALADSTRGRGRARIRQVAGSATGRAANPFESTLRAQASLVPGLNVVPQHAIEIPGSGVLHPDLVDVDLRVALECEGFEWHGESKALTRDCHRYNRLVLHGWQVIRFSWAMVMYDAAYVHRVLVGVVAAAHRHANVA